jgi:hypothetical protein
MPGKKGRAKTEATPLKLVTPRQLYWVALLLGFAALFAYAFGLYLERTAPVDPVTGFHVSVAGAIVYMAYPVVSVVQTFILIGACAVLFSGRKWRAQGLGLLVLGLGFMAVNYLVSQ